MAANSRPVLDILAEYALNLNLGWPNSEFIRAPVHGMRASTSTMARKISRIDDISALLGPICL